MSDIGSIAPRKGEDVAWRRTRDMRNKVEQRAREKGIPLSLALQELSEEGLLSDLDRERTETLANRTREKEGAVGWGRDAFARAVELERQTLATCKPQLSVREVFLMASNHVAQCSPQALADYRNDARKL